MKDKLQYEKECLSQGFKLIAGVDEVGRGPLAGPVVCCSLIMPLTDLIEGVDDSKKVPEKKREALAEIIKQKAICYNIKEVSPERIDEINILNAVKECMNGAVDGLSVKPDIVFVDGNDINLREDAKYIIKGDAKSYTIACASIVAKVYRDNLMKEYAKEFSIYGFEKHKGYGTKAHIDAIKENGPCKIHRKTFIKNFWGNTGK